MENLRKVIENQKFNNEFSHKLLNFEYHFRNIFEVCSFSFEKNCGSYLIDGLNYEYQIETYEKQKLLYEKSKNKKIQKNAHLYIAPNFFYCIFDIKDSKEKFIKLIFFWKYP